ncbi:hypothetical protein TNCV_3741631 [Trichonephila clavipes]|nr:hypothetical protein TNCV_3741631 [Trichonephila clavipes]
MESGNSLPQFNLSVQGGTQGRSHTVSIRLLILQCFRAAVAKLFGLTDQESCHCLPPVDPPCPELATGSLKKKRVAWRRGRGALPWMEKKKKPCPRTREHERRALVGTDWKRALAGWNLRRALKKMTWSEIGVERKERR